MEVGDAILILDDDFAIDDSRLTRESRDSLDYPAIGAGPIPSMPGEGPDLAAVDDDEGAVAVMLDLVNPQFSGGRFRHKCWDFLPYEAERRRLMRPAYFSYLVARLRKDVGQSVS